MKSFLVRSAWLWSVVSACVLSATILPAAEPSIAQSRQKGVDFLRTTQRDDGSWAEKAPGVSGLMTYALLRAGVTPEDPTVAKALKHLESFIQPDGGIYDVKTGHKNYETSICLLAFQTANKQGKYDSIIAHARDAIKTLQWDEGEGTKREDVKFGGAGYGRTNNRPDLSNTAFLLDALKAAGVKADDPSMQNALVFVSRCQNLESQANTTEFAAKINDGGFYYTPANGGQSMAGKTANGGLRSYASMTYTGLRSMIYAGLTPDDPRVKAALSWIQKHYTLKENPGMGQAGRYYFFHTFAKALDALGKPQIVDDKGVSHDWRKELSAELLSLQKANGSWLNSEKRWMEADPNMATAYALLALAYCQETP